MQSLADLLSAVKEARKMKNDADLARALGVTSATISNWKVGRNLPGTLQCARIAELAGVPVNRVIGLVGEARAVDREEKAIWRQVATAAALVLMLAGGYVRPATAAIASADAAAMAPPIHYAHC